MRARVFASANNLFAFFLSCLRVLCHLYVCPFGQCIGIMSSILSSLFVTMFYHKCILQYYYYNNNCKTVHTSGAFFAVLTVNVCALQSALVHFYGMLFFGSDYNFTFHVHLLTPFIMLVSDWKILTALYNVTCRAIASSFYYEHFQTHMLINICIT